MIPRRRARPGIVSACVVFATGVMQPACDTPSNRPAVPHQKLSRAPERSPAAKSAPPPSRGTHFDPATVPLAPDTPEQKALRALEQEDAPRALAILEPALQNPEDALQEGRLRWLAVEAAERSQSADAVEQHLSSLAESGHPLQPWARLRLGTLKVEREPRAVHPIARELGRQSWPGQDEARLLEARTLPHVTPPKGAIARLRRLTAQAQGNEVRVQLMLRLAAALAERPQRKHREEAYRLLGRVIHRAPLGRAAREAEERAEALVERFPSRVRRRITRDRLQTQLDHAEALVRARRHRRAEKALKQIVDQAQTGSSTYCKARLLLGKALLGRRKRQKAVPLLRAVARRCRRTPDVRARARYLAGRTYSKLGEFQRAIGQYQALVKESPKHRLADDGLYRAALAARELGDQAGMSRRLAQVARRFPTGDMRAEARFLLAWTEREMAGQSSRPRAARARLRRALDELKQLQVEGPGENAEDIRGRAAYWEARTLEQLGEHEAAVEAWARLVRLRPLSYYAQQSLARLSENSPDVAASLVREWGQPPSERPRFRFVQEKLHSSPGFRRAVELLRVGDSERARKELDALRKRAQRDGGESFVWSIAATLHKVGAEGEASRLARRHLGGFMSRPPRGEAYPQWRIAYPAAFSPLIEETAKAEGVPAAWIRSVAREESAFDPKAVSVANAYGLLQIIVPTARRFAEELGLQADSQSLRTAPVSIRIGARFMAFLRARFDRHPGCVAAAYNAGEGAVSRWLRERGEQPFDEWIENIPYDETRRYTRRVVQTYGVYRWLDTGSLPELPRQLPTRRTDHSSSESSEP